MNRDPMVDLDRLLTDFAWNELAETNFFDRIFKNKKYELEVNWSYLDINHCLTKFNIRSQQESEPSGLLRPRTTVDKMKKQVVQRDLCLFRTEFTNTSDEGQTFTFKTERKTTSRCDVNIQRGFKIGGQVDVRLSLPTSPSLPRPDSLAGGEIDTCRITGGLSGELQVTKATGQTIEENLTWGVDSQVKVERKSRVVAALIIREEELTADFVITTTIRAIHSIVPVYVKDKKTKQCLEILEISADNLSRILRSDHGFSRVEDNVVQYLTKGHLRAVYGAQQLIRVDSFKYTDDEEVGRGIVEEVA